MVRVSRGEAFSGPAAVAWAALVLVFAIFSSSTTAEARLSVSTVGYTYDSAATRAATTTVPSTGLAALGIPPSSEALGCVYDSPKNPVATNTADDLIARLSYSDKIRGQMGPRGWTDDLVEETIGSPARTETVWDLTGGSKEAATAFVRSDGTYVVVNDTSGLIVQVSDRLNPNWKPVWSDPRFQR